MQQIFDLLNFSLFNGMLPDCLLTIGEVKNGTGSFNHSCWQSETGNLHQITINPKVVQNNYTAMIQTFLHEMCHLWQACFGTPSKNGYHNFEWANKMESLGLMPSNTGRKNGKRVGFTMSDYIIKGGEFEKLLVANLDSIKIPLQK